MIVELLALLAVCVVGGFALLLWSWADRRKRDWLSAITETDLAGGAFGSTSAVNGVTDAPSLVVSPVTNTPCVFYEKQVDVQSTDSSDIRDAGDAIAMGLDVAGKMIWMKESVEHIGGFFLTNGTTRAFVFPHGADLRGGREKSMQDPNIMTTRRITERVVLNGQTVCVIGRPRSVEELLSAIRKDAGLDTDTLRALQAAGPMNCYFNDGKGPFLVAAGTFSDLKAAAAESAGTLFWAGLGMLGMGAFIAVVVVLTLLKII